MKIGFLWAITVAFALAAFFGCSRDGRQEVVASVNGAVLSRAELNVRAENIVALYAHKLGEKATTNFLGKVRSTFLCGYAKVWTEARVLENYAKAEGIVVSNELIAACQRAAFSNFKAKGDRKYENLLAIKGLDRSLWNDQILSEARQRAVREYLSAAQPVTVPSDYAAGVIARLKAWNESMVLTNAIQYAKATNAWQRLRSGEDFAAVAKACTEISDEAEEGGDWLTVDAKFLDDSPKLVAALRKIKVGDFTPPVEGDNGLMIARIDGIDDEGAWTLSRIFFHLGLFQYPASEAEITAARVRALENEQFDRFLAGLVAAADVVIYENREQDKEKEKGK